MEKFNNVLEELNERIAEHEPFIADVLIDICFPMHCFLMFAKRRGRPSTFSSSMHEYFHLVRTSLRLWRFQMYVHRDFDEYEDHVLFMKIKEFEEFRAREKRTADLTLAYNAVIGFKTLPEIRAAVLSFF